MKGRFHIQKTLGISLFLSLLLFYFSLPTETEVLKEQTTHSPRVSRDQIKLSVSALKKEVPVEETVKKKVEMSQKERERQKTAEKKIIEKKAENLQKKVKLKHYENFSQDYDRIENQWKDKVKTLISESFKGREQIFTEYSKIKDSYEEDKAEAQEAFNEFMAAQEENPDYFYDNSGDVNDMSDYQSELNETYLQRLKELFGENLYFRYLEAKDQFNESINQNRSFDRGVVLMEI